MNRYLIFLILLMSLIQSPQVNSEPVNDNYWEYTNSNENWNETVDEYINENGYILAVSKTYHTYETNKFEYLYENKTGYFMGYNNLHPKGNASVRFNFHNISNDIYLIGSVESNGVSIYENYTSYYNSKFLSNSTIFPLETYTLSTGEDVNAYKIQLILDLGHSNHSFRYEYNNGTIINEIQNNTVQWAEMIITGYYVPIVQRIIDITSEMKYYNITMFNSYGLGLDGETGLFSDKILTDYRVSGLEPIPIVYGDPATKVEIKQSKTADTTFYMLSILLLLPILRKIKTHR